MLNASILKRRYFCLLVKRANSTNFLVQSFESEQPSSFVTGLSMVVFHSQNQSSYVVLHLSAAELAMK